MIPAQLPASLGLVGTGRVSSALGRAARAAGVSIAWVAGRTPSATAALAAELGCPAVELDAVRPAGLVVVSVSDDALESVADSLAATAPGPGTAVHTCGARGRGALATLADAGWEVGAWHPLQAFATTRTELAAGVTFAVTADPPLADRLDALARALGGVPLWLADADRARYHAAAVLAANYAGVLLYHASGLLSSCGLDGDAALAALTPLVRTTLDGIAEFGLPAGLTGPAVRGDAGTIQRHVAAIADAPTAAELYRACGQAALPILVERGLAPDAVAAVRAAVTQPGFCSTWA